MQDAVLSCAREVELKNDHCERLTVKVKKMENMIRVLQEEICETKEIKSQLEHQKVVWEHELCSLRFNLKEEEERRNADMLSENTREELRRKAEEYRKEVEVREQLEQFLKTRNTEMGILRNDLYEMSQSYEKEQDLLHQNCMLQEQTAMPRMERDRTQMQNQEKEEKYFKAIKIIQELYKNENLEMTIQQTGETIANTIPQYVGQLALLVSENAILNAQLENERQNKERLQTELESYRSRLTTTVYDLDQTKASRRHLEFALERSRNESVYLKDKINFYVSYLKENKEILSQNLSKAENKINSLENELRHTRDVLAEKTSVLECIPRDLEQTECGSKEMEQRCGNEDGQVKKSLAKQESLEERVSPPESENILLGQQLEGAENKANHKDKAVINMQGQFYDLAKNLQTESGNQNLPVEDRLNSLINEFNELNERLYRHEKGKAEEVDDDLMESLETVCSRCRYLDAENQVDQEELLSMEAMQEQCEILEKENMKLEEEYLDLKNHMEQNMVDVGEVKKYREEIEERATQCVTEKLKEINVCLQAQAASEEYREQIREDHLTSIRSHMAVKIKNLESEISNMKSSQGAFHNVEVEKYKHLYQVELEARKSFLKKVKKSTKRLAAFSSKVVVETQDTGTSFPTPATETGIESPSVGTLHNGLGVHREFTSRGNSTFSSSFPWTSDTSLETYLTEVSYIVFFPLGFRFLI
ncbi:ankyrin repeat domain-containing protein 26-like [Microcebus murinus]|uniref:ankyrin repeat domain-containing protein 26-like n=1 Tax=Microcebus murinus TaxID=30608 RepID=UPI003F6ADE3D